MNTADRLNRVLKNGGITAGATVIAIGFLCDELDVVRAAMDERDQRIDRLEVRVKLLQDTMALDEKIPLPCSRETHCEPYVYHHTGALL